MKDEETTTTANAISDVAIGNPIAEEVSFPASSATYGNFDGSNTIVTGKVVDVQPAP